MHENIAVAVRQVIEALQGPGEPAWRPAAKRAGITRIAELTGLDTLGIPVFAAIRPMGKSLSTQQGKGTTALAAKVSALVESLETWSAEHLADNPALRGVRATWRQLGAQRFGE